MACFYRASSVEEYLQSLLFLVAGVWVGDEGQPTDMVAEPPVLLKLVVLETDRVEVVVVRY